MGKISGREGRVMYGAAATLSTPGAVHNAGVVTITTAAAHGFVAGDRIYITGVVGMTSLNGKSFKVVSAPTGVTLTISHSTTQSWTSGGTVKRTIELVSFEMEKTSEEADVSDSSTDIDAEYVPAGKVRRSGSMEGMLYTGQIDPPFTELMDAVFKINSEVSYAGQIFITNEKIGPVDIPGANAVKVSYNWRGTGIFVKTDTAI